MALKENTLGLGAKSGGGGLVDGERTGLDIFQSVLGRLNGKSEEALLKEQAARDDLRRGEYIESRVGAMKFVKGGWLVGNDVQDRREVEEIEVQPSSEQVEKEGKSSKKRDKEGKAQKKRRKEKSEQQVAEDLPRTQEQLQEIRFDADMTEGEAKLKKKKIKEGKDKKTKKRRRDEVEEQVKDSSNDMPSIGEASKDTDVTISSQGVETLKDTAPAPAPVITHQLFPPTQDGQQASDEPSTEQATATAPTQATQPSREKPGKVSRRQAFRQYILQHPITPDPESIPNGKDLSPEQLTRAALRGARKEWCKSERRARREAKKIRKRETGFGSTTEEKRIQKFKKRPEVATPGALAALLSKPPTPEVKAAALAALAAKAARTAAAKERRKLRSKGLGAKAGSGANATALGGRGVEGTGADGVGVEGDGGSEEARNKGAREKSNDAGAADDKDNVRTGVAKAEAPSTAEVPSPAEAVNVVMHDGEAEEVGGDKTKEAAAVRGSRAMLRQKSIEQKRMAVRDQRALNEVRLYFHSLTVLSFLPILPSLIFARSLQRRCLGALCSAVVRLETNWMDDCKRVDSDDQDLIFSLWGDHVVVWYWLCRCWLLVVAVGINHERLQIRYRHACSCYATPVMLLWLCGNILSCCHIAPPVIAAVIAQALIGPHMRE